MNWQHNLLAAATDLTYANPTDRARMVEAARQRLIASGDRHEPPSTYDEFLVALADSLQFDAYTDLPLGTP